VPINTLETLEIARSRPENRFAVHQIVTLKEAVTQVYFVFLNKQTASWRALEWIKSSFNVERL